MAIPGHATSLGTKRYKDRMSSIGAPEHYRKSPLKTTLHEDNSRLWFSSIGLGSHLGNHDEATDLRYCDAVIRAVELGCNVIDTAINYRFQRSERAIGRAIQQVIGRGKAQRDELIVTTKGGFIPGDTEPPRNFFSYFDETFVNPGLATRDDLVMGCHCMVPAFLQNQLDTSLANLGLDCVDIYYLHNPETQLEEINGNQFLNRIRAAFELLEKNVTDGKIQYYGTATWNGYRVASDLPEHLELEKLIQVAEEIGGKIHHFKAIQLPFNLTMMEALLDPTQISQGNLIPLLSTAQQHGMIVMASASILQGQLSQNLPAHLAPLFTGLSNDAQRAIQFTRSAPGITTALVGMSHVHHVEENLKVGAVPPLSEKEFMELFSEE